MADGLDTAISNSFILGNDEVVIMLLAIPLYYRAFIHIRVWGMKKDSFRNFYGLCSLLHLLRLDGPA